MSVVQVAKNKRNKKGDSWIYRCYYTDVYGERKQTYSKLYPTKAEAKEAERKFLNDINNHTINYNQISFSELYDNWWEVKKKELKISNAKNLKPSLDKNILEYFEPYKLEAININVLKQYLRFMERKSLTTNYKNVMVSYLKECLLYACIYYNFDPRIANYITKFRNDIPKESPKDSEINFWTKEEFIKFISCVDDGYYNLVFTFLYRTGLRVGEFRALKWTDLDLDNETLNISKELARGLTIKPKTSNSIRIIDLDIHLVKYLTEYKKQQEKIYGFSKDWYIFGGITSTSNNTLRRHLNKYIDIANVKHLTIHGFRHSHVSLLIHLGCDSRDVAERVGDTVHTIEHTYYHMFPKKKKEIVNRLNDMER